MLHRLIRSTCAFSACASIFFVLLISPGFAQDKTVVAKIDRHIESGEFSRAIELTRGLTETYNADPIYARIAEGQSDSGASGSGSAAYITNDDLRNDVFNRMQDNARNGGAGGVTRQDFDDLINLITETISPDDWEANGGTGRIAAFPGGVYVDGKGTLRTLKTSKLSDWNDTRSIAKRNLNAKAIAGSTDLRFVSITRLEKELQRLAILGQQPTDSMRYLGGIYELQYLIVLEDTREVVIAGPAGPWQESVEGRIVNTETGRPVLQLDDLVVAIRNARNHDGKFYCSIEPRKDNLKAANDFKSTTKLTGHRMREGLRKALGEQDIVIEGINPRSHAALVLVEADYRMKRVGMGLEPGVLGLPSYLDMIKVDEQGRAPAADVIRWWFTTNYKAIETNATRDVFKLNGQGVKVLSENELVTDSGERIHTGKSNENVAAFARNFTKHFPEMSKKYPVYGELKNLFDLTLVAALIESESVRDRANVSLPFFNAPHSSKDFVYQIRLDNVPKSVESIMNHRIIKKRNGRTTSLTTVIGVSGGVSFDSKSLTEKSKIKTTQFQTVQNEQVKNDVQNHEQWYWND